MKNLIALIAIFLSAMQVYAQAPVTNINWLPNAGDKFYIYRITKGQTTDPYINPGDTGANVIWDFNNKTFSLNFPTDSILFKSPSAIPVTPENTQSNLAIGDSTNYTCYIKNSQGLSLTQSRSTAENNPQFPIIKSIYTNSRLFFKNNLAFRDTYFDTSVFYHHYKHSGSDSPSRGRSISIQKYDAYGTLKISGLQFDNVIRTFEQRQQWDSSYNSNNKFYSFSKIYSWHSNSLKNALLTYIEAYNVKKNGSTYDTTRYSSLTLKLPSTFSTDIFSPEASASQISAVYKNNEIRITSQKDVGNAKFAVYDIQGKVIKQGKINLYAQNRETIQLTLPKGTYLLKLEGKNSHIKTFKLINL